MTQRQLPDGWTIQRHDWVVSTNQVALELGQTGAPEGTVIVAAGQTEGRGRQGRRWESPHGHNLYVSIILRPRVLASQVSILTLVAGLAAVEMLVQDYNITAQVKWPNDIWINGKKVGGILSELVTTDTHVDYVVLGFGLNVNACSSDFSPDVAKIATSLAEVAGKQFDLDDMLAAWCQHLAHCYQEFTVDEFGGMQSEYEAVMALKGQSVQVRCGSATHAGIIRGVDVVGRLLLEKNGQTLTLDVGEVEQTCCS